MKKPSESDAGGNLEMEMDEEMSSDFDILDNVDSVYFTEDFSPSRYELEVILF